MVGAVSESNIAYKILYSSQNHCNKEYARFSTLYYRTLGNTSSEFSTFLPLLLYLLPSLFCLKTQALTALLQGRWFQNTNTNNVFKNTKKSDVFKGKAITVSDIIWGRG